MRVTQGTFSFLPDLTDEQIAAQLRYALEMAGRSWSSTPTIRTRATRSGTCGASRCSSSWRRGPRDRAARGPGLPRGAPDHYVKLIAYDRRCGRQTTALSFIVNRPAAEPGFRLERADGHDRVDPLHAASVRDRQRPAGATRHDAKRHDGACASTAPDAVTADELHAGDPARSDIERSWPSSIASWSRWRRSRPASARSPRCS